MVKRKFSRGMKKFIRKEKSRIRKMNLEKAEQEKLIHELLDSLQKELQNVK